MLTDVTATRYVTPLREGGSLPGLMEADDLGTYVVKFRRRRPGPSGAGRRGGRRASWPARSGCGCRDLVTVEVDPALAPGEPDQEVQDLLRRQRWPQPRRGLPARARSTSTRSRSRWTPGSAGRVLWFDALVGNADRSWRNPNLLYWHGRLVPHRPRRDADVPAPLGRAWTAGRGGRTTRATTRWSRSAPDVVGADADAGPAGDRRVLASRCRRGPATCGWTRPASTVRCARRLRRRLLRRRLDARGRLAAAAGRVGRAPRVGPRGPPATQPGGRPGSSGAGARGGVVTGPPYVFEYAVLRVVPRVERGESINAGVLVWCKQLGYLGARAHLDRDRLLALDPGADVDAVERALRAVCDVVPGPGPDAGSAAHRRGRPDVPLADRAAQHGRAAGAGAHRAHRRPGRRGRPAASPCSSCRSRDGDRPHG